VVDYFAQVSDEFLEENKLTKSASNFVSRSRVDELAAASEIIAVFAGDNARNAAEAVSRLRGRAAFAGNIGADEEGRIIKENLNAVGIESFLEIALGNTGKIITFITPDKERSFAVNLGNSTEYYKLPLEEATDSKYFYYTSISVLGKHRLADTIKHTVDELNGEAWIALSLESPPMIKEHRKELLGLIGKSDIVFANEYELTSLTGKGINESVDEIGELVELLYIKLGEKGSLAVYKGKTENIPAYTAQPIDLTGAGDFYAGGVLQALSSGKGFKQAGSIGSFIGARVVEQLGARLPELVLPTRLG